MCVMAALSVLMIPTTYKQALPDTVKEGEAIGSNQNMLFLYVYFTIQMSTFGTFMVPLLTYTVQSLNWICIVDQLDISQNITIIGMPAEIQDKLIRCVIRIGF